ncbi:thermonuclease family protein [Virgisporangium aurantiacum]|uniref:Uncharacterized protein n=1 Tax=Virgisporangium aurantiacum TaxID=175570 RepID=A0A8J4E5J1_9ACTN|nr:hypothetical protein [Virgisporangium aurantiacum]GIJ62143.1 hypothetical protein Vau01_096590 [Virgisporangium aurantiacum]
MANAIRQLDSGLVVGTALLGRHGAGRGSVAEQVHDGDTVTVEADGNFGVRFLGVDAPEVSCNLPGTKRPFLPINDPRWQKVLTDPFAADLPPFGTPLDHALRHRITDLAAPDLADNHARHGAAATRALESLVAGDLTALGHTTQTFRFFIAFAGEVMDRYGRLLGYLHPSQPDTPAGQRLLSYNERLLQLGWVTPYFIWPNINPFRAAPSLLDAVPQPGTAADLATTVPALRNARTWTQNARSQHLGLHEAGDPLRLQPFELRFLARRQPPDRWVLDLSRNDRRLVPPQGYIDIVYPEDRLLIPAEYVPLWQHHGWQLG